MSDDLRTTAQSAAISDLLAKVAVDRDDDPWCAVAADEIERRDADYQTLLDAIKVAIEELTTRPVSVHNAVATLRAALGERQ